MSWAWLFTYTGAFALDEQVRSGEVIRSAVGVFGALLNFTVRRALLLKCFREMLPSLVERNPICIVALFAAAMSVTPLTTFQPTLVGEMPHPPVEVKFCVSSFSRHRFGSLFQVKPAVPGP